MWTWPGGLGALSARACRGSSSSAAAEVRRSSLGGTRAHALGVMPLAASNMITWKLTTENFNKIYKHFGTTWVCRQHDYLEAYQNH